MQYGISIDHKTGLWNIKLQVTLVVGNSNICLESLATLQIFK